MFEKLCNLFELNKDAVIAAKDKEIAYMNKAALALFPELSPGCTLPAMFFSVLSEYTGDNLACTIVINEKKADVVVTDINEYTVFSIAVQDNEEMKDSLKLLASFSGAIKSTLAVFQMSSRLIMPHVENMNDPQLDKYLAMHIHSYYSMLRIIENIAKISSAGAIDQKNVFDLVSLCKNLVDSVSHFIKDRNIEFRFETDSDFVSIDGSFALIESTLLNLFSNSIKNIASGGVVKLSLSASGEHVRLAVADTGSGIPAEAMKNVFSKYKDFKGFPEKNEGVGIGLSAVRQVVESHNGSVVLESRDGIGTTVIITLPIAQGYDNQLRSEIVGYRTEDMHGILTELSDVLDYEKYLPRYLD